MQEAPSDAPTLPPIPTFPILADEVPMKDGVALRYEGQFDDEDGTKIRQAHSDMREKKETDSEKKSDEGEETIPFALLVAHTTQSEPRNDLENYCHTLRRTLTRAKLQVKFKDGDEEKIELAVQDALHSLANNLLDTRSDFEGKLKELEGMVECIKVAADPYDFLEINGTMRVMKSIADLSGAVQQHEVGEFDGAEGTQMQQVPFAHFTANHRQSEPKYGLENYCFMLRNTLRRVKLQVKFKDGDEEQIEKVVQDTLNWLAGRLLDKGSDFEGKQKELESIVDRISVAVDLKDIQDMSGTLQPVEYTDSNSSDLEDEEADEEQSVVDDGKKEADEDDAEENVEDGSADSAAALESAFLEQKRRAEVARKEYERVKTALETRARELMAPSLAG
ncbi:unnamed protein product [Prorocentrum cordatum]|uniref:Uncharacterized protein n=1 Tax=Prorocentrum cordatum TaxID=2364126 RepID=A0ABN9Y3K6_9DINO|nr:unnamed protein product [Polarella glacialis]